MPARGFFVTGTDTGVGKTLVTCALLHRWRAQGASAIGMKPVAAGCEPSVHGLVNADVEALRAASSIALPRESINVYAFEAPIAPHIAAERAGIAIDLERIAECYSDLAARADVVVVEGVGGFLVPLGREQTFADLPERLGLPVILVVGVRLGCLNHALLTAEAIRRRGLQLCGWVANCIDPSMQCFEENLATLHTMLPEQNLGVLPFQKQPRPECVELEIPRHA